jgi:hypothetical protein
MSLCEKNPNDHDLKKFCHISSKSANHYHKFLNSEFRTTVKQSAGQDIAERFNEYTTLKTPRRYTP